MEERKRPMNTIGVLWGFQRNYKSRFSLDLNIGPAYLFARSSVPDTYGNPHKRTVGEFSTMGRITLGFWVNKWA